MLIGGLFLTSKPAYTPSSNTYTTPGTGSVSVPAGATYVVAEVIAGGNAGLGVASYPSGGIGGGGGAYSKSNPMPLVGISTIWYDVGDGGATNGALGTDSVVRYTNSGGTILALAAAGASTGAGGLASSGTGALKNNGGDGLVEVRSGGGAGGPDADGGDVTGTPGTDGVAGAGGGGSAGDGAIWNANGGNYGGGGASFLDADVNFFTPGAGGWVKLSWT